MKPSRQQLAIIFFGMYAVLCSFTMILAAQAGAWNFFIIIAVLLLAAGVSVIAYSVHKFKDNKKEKL